MSSSNANTRSSADAVKSPPKSAKQAAQGALSNDGGHSEDPAQLTQPPTMETEHHAAAHDEPRSGHPPKKNPSAEENTDTKSAHAAVDAQEEISTLSATPTDSTHLTASDQAQLSDYTSVSEGKAIIDFKNVTLPFRLEPSCFWGMQLFRDAWFVQIISMPANTVLHAADVAKWLDDRPTTPAADNRKVLLIKEADLDEPVIALYGKLRELFLAATTPAPYMMQIKMRRPVYYAQVSSTLDHPTTDERLMVQPEFEFGWENDGVITGAQMLDNPSSSIVVCRMIVRAQDRALEEELRKLDLLPRLD